jgi:hypothetical protein
VVDDRGERIDTMAGFWLDPSTFQVAYIGVKGLSLPHDCRVVPVAGCHIEGQKMIRVGYSADYIRRAPIAHPGLELAQVEKELVN